MEYMDYLYLDRKRLLSYLEQADELEHWGTLRELGFEAGIATLKGTTKTADRVRPWGDHEAAVRVEEIMIGTNHLDFGRPTSHIDATFSPRMFVSEIMTAVKVVIPIPQESRTGLKELVVWSAEPYLEDYDSTAPAWQAQGTFLLLVADPSVAGGGYSGTLSGKSALYSLISESLPGQETPFGYLNEKKSGFKPLEVLQKIGGVTSDPRKVKALYKKRFIADEQFYEIDGKERRSNLLIGYPLLISEVPWNKARL